MPIDFTLPDQDGNPVSATDFRGKKLIMIFYPAAITPGSTTESCDYRDNYGDHQRAGYELV
ncbi:MAG: redoxin domain-containing protein, partial [Acidimicrobiia bacterium]